MSQAQDYPNTLEQRFLEKQAALFRDVLEGNELNPNNYVLRLTPEEQEAYYAGPDADTEGTEGLSPS